MNWLSRRRWRVAPTPTAASAAARGPRRILLLSVYNFAIWLLLTVVLFAQFFGVIWSSVTTRFEVFYGQQLTQGRFAIPGFNDEPYTDRAVACVRHGQYFRPMQLSQLLKSHANATATTNGIDGYRMISRDSFTMDAASFPIYEHQCSTLLATLDTVLSVCTTLGFNVTRDVLRIVDGVDSDTVVVLDAALPVFMIPVWDKGSLSRYVVPGLDGSACVFRGSGTFQNELDATSALFIAVPRDVRESKTQELLGAYGGVWRNGWYEDLAANTRWYADVLSSKPDGEYGIFGRHFDLFDGGRELDCAAPPLGCGGGTSTWSWGRQLKMQLGYDWFHSITISNGARFGLFVFNADVVQAITSRYSLEKLIANATFVVLLARWLVAMAALVRVDAIGLGAVANARSFHVLPLLLLPRLKSSLEGFWASGCQFEGDERVLAEAWFEIYPAIGEVLLVYFSLLNTVAKLLRRRVSDALFGPTLLFFGLLHRLRLEIQVSDLLAYGQRISTVITADEVDAARLVDFFTTDVAFRLNGEIRSLFYIKAAVLALNLLPLLVASRRTTEPGGDAAETLAVERALAFCFSGNAGLGSTASPYVETAPDESPTTPATCGGRAVRPYEVVRGGYVVVADASSSASGVLLSMDHWYWLLAAALGRQAAPLTARVVVFEVDAAEHKTRPGVDPLMVAVGDEQVARLSPWRVSARALR